MQDYYRKKSNIYKAGLFEAFCELTEGLNMAFKSYDYDLKNEIEEYRQCGEDDLYKFLLYKSTAVEKNFDCDRSAYAKSLYNKLWGFDINNRENFQYIHVGNQEILMGMDTMNSFWTTFAWCLNKWCSDDIHKEFGLRAVTANSAQVLLSNYSALKKIMINNLSKDIFDKFVLFAKLTHSIGNLLLVPKKLEPHTHGRQTFNTARASKWNDYFDLSMQWILRNDEPLWDEKTVNDYLDLFDLRDYVTEDNTIIPLIESHRKIIHGGENIDSRPQNKLEIEQLLDNINNRIMKRGKRLYAKLTNTEYVEQEELNKSYPTNKAKIIFIKNILFHMTWITLLFFSPFSLIQGAVLLDLTSLSLVIIIPLMLVELCALIYLAYWLANRKKQKVVHANVANSSNDQPTKIKTIKKINKKTVIGLIVWTIWMGVGIWLYSDDFVHDNIFITVGLFYFMIYFAGFPFLILYFKYGIKLRCRKCKLFYMLKRERLEKLSEKNIVIKVTNEKKDSDGYVISTSEQHLPGTRTHYKQHYKCKICNTFHYSVYSKEHLAV